MLFMLVWWYIGSLCWRPILTLWLTLWGWCLAHLYGCSTNTAELHSIGNLAFTARTDHVMTSLFGLALLYSSLRYDLASRREKRGLADGLKPENSIYRSIISYLSEN